MVKQKFADEYDIDSTPGQKSMREFRKEVDRTTKSLERSGTTARRTGRDFASPGDAGRIGGAGIGGRRRGGGAVGRGGGPGGFVRSRIARAGGGLAAGALIGKFALDIFGEAINPANIEDPIIRAAEQRFEENLLNQPGAAGFQKVAGFIPLIGGIIQDIGKTGNRIAAQFTTGPTFEELGRESAAEFLAKQALEQREQQLATQRTMAIAMQGLERNSRPEPSLGPGSGW